MALAIYQPKPRGYLFAAYRPIPMQVNLDYSALASVPPIPQVVFCDIYFGGIYYKTLSSTVSEMMLVSSGSLLAGQKRPVWTFDIADAAQEYLRSFPPSLTGNTMERDSKAVSEFFVAFRDSSTNAAGFIIPQGPVPVQGNFTSQPIAGGGLFSFGYQVLNSTLQHEDVQDLAAHLSSYSVLPTDGNYKAYPVSHRPGKIYTLAPDQYDHFPIVIPFGGLGGVSPQSGGMTLFGKYKNGTAFQAVLTGAGVSFFEGAMYYVPTGIPQLSSLTWSTAIVWSNVATYQVSLYAGNVLGRFWDSPVMTKGSSCAGGARLHFLNALGGYDAVNFSERIETQNTKSESWQKSLPVVGMQKRSAGRQRFGIRSNREVLVRTASYPESAQPWLEELARSPSVYLEWKGTQGQADDLVPIKIADGKVVSRKTEERYEYLLEITYEMSNEKIIQRG
jgi:hypothetical protein